MRQENRHPFYRPLWVRAGIVGVCAGWSLLEWIGGEAFWGTLTLGITAYAVWSFFIAYPPKDEPQDG